MKKDYKDIFYIEQELAEFYTKNSKAKGSGFGRRLINLYASETQSATQIYKQRGKLLEACEAMVENIDKWIESGKPATEKRSEELYIQMKAAINKC